MNPNLPATDLSELVFQFPSSPSVPALAAQITASSSLTCTDHEKLSLAAAGESLEGAVVLLVEAVEAVQEQLQTLTGTTASASVLEAALSTPAPTTTTNSSESGNCSNCVFPFVYYGRQIERCTTFDDLKPWCATSVNSKGEMKDWEYCTDSSCPGLPGNSPLMAVHPLNDAGNCCKWIITLSIIFYSFSRLWNS